jgi:hypothetical protein
MTLFNYSKWVARQITNKSKNVDKKIFIIGPAGSGKSKTGLTLAVAIARWVSYYVYGDFDHWKEFFNFDPDHVAVIDTSDLVALMIKKLKRFSIKIVDDCGTAEGITARRSMSQANLDTVSIYGTNRTDNGVTIICVQDTSFTDKRMRMLADEVIDLNEFVQQGPVRIGKLWKVRMDRNSKYGMRLCRFMTYNNGQWVTIEGIACFMPDQPGHGIDGEYNKLRKTKQDAQSEKMSSKYKKIEQDIEIQNERQKCPYCNSIQLRQRSKGLKCEKCGRYV